MNPKKDNLIMELLKVSEFSQFIGFTNRGNLTLKLIYDGGINDYRFYLDSVPLDDKSNKAMIKLLFK